MVYSVTYYLVFDNAIVFLVWILFVTNKGRINCLDIVKHYSIIKHCAFVHVGPENIIMGCHS